MMRLMSLVLLEVSIMLASGCATDALRTGGDDDILRVLQEDEFKRVEWRVTERHEPVSGSTNDIYLEIASFHKGTSTRHGLTCKVDVVDRHVFSASIFRDGKLLRSARWDHAEEVPDERQTSAARILMLLQEEEFQGVEWHAAEVYGPLREGTSGIYLEIASYRKRTGHHGLAFRLDVVERRLHEVSVFRDGELSSTE